MGRNQTDRQSPCVATHPVVLVSGGKRNEQYRILEWARLTPKQLLKSRLVPPAPPNASDAIGGGPRRLHRGLIARLGELAVIQLT